MNANAWAALGMSVTDASKQASKQTWGLKKLPLFPVLKSVSHWLRTSCFCQTCIHSSVFFARFPYPERKRFVLYFKFHCLRFIFSIIYSWKKKNSLWMFAGTSAERFFQMEHCLSMSWRSLPVLMEKISVARNMEKVALFLHEPVLFSFSASCSFLSSRSTQLSLKQSSRPGHGWISEGF